MMRDSGSVKFRWAFGVGRRLRRVGDRRGGALRLPAGLARLALPLGALGLRGRRGLGGRRRGPRPPGRPWPRGSWRAGSRGGPARPAARPRAGPLPYWASSAASTRWASARRAAISCSSLPLRLAHPAVAHGLVLRGVGQDLGPVQGHVAQLDQPGPLAEVEDLQEQPGQGRQVRLPEGRDACRGRGAGWPRAPGRGSPRRSPARSAGRTACRCSSA